MLDFYRNKKVFVTGHSGFKGTWLCKILTMFGANIVGYSLEPDKDSFFYSSGVASNVKSIFADIRDFETLKKAFDESRPEIVFHLAAQPLVRESYKEPRLTFDTNIMGTVNVLECIRLTNTVRSFLNVTTDKVYENREYNHYYTEDENLKGFDPYSNSKSCSELITFSYKKSFLDDRNIAVSTARAGNVIGGGDFAKDRIIPDCVRAAMAGNKIEVRNPYSIRPYQHVLEPIYAYLLIVQRQYENNKFSDCYNVGPDETDCITTGRLTDLFCKEWGNNLEWINTSDNGPYEANLLMLDSSKIRGAFGWQPKWHIDETIKQTVDWYRCFVEKGDIAGFMNKQILFFVKG